MVLYTCGEGTRSRSFGGLLAHPCGRAAKALDDGGHLYETKRQWIGTFEDFRSRRRSTSMREARSTSTCGSGDVEGEAASPP
jgi:hypothetical protein